MSYARLGQDGSDVYVFMHVYGHLECCFCSIAKNRSFQAASTMEMLTHLDHHRSVGDYVPGHVALDLQLDDEENFPR